MHVHGVCVKSLLPVVERSPVSITENTAVLGNTAQLSLEIRARYHMTRVCASNHWRVINIIWTIGPSTFKSLLLCIHIQRHDRLNETSHKS